MRAQVRENNGANDDASVLRRHLESFFVAFDIGGRRRVMQGAGFVGPGSLKNFSDPFGLGFAAAARKNHDPIIQAIGIPVRFGLGESQSHEPLGGGGA